MEPLTPEQKQRIIARARAEHEQAMKGNMDPLSAEERAEMVSNAAADPDEVLADIEEYERLLGERFTEDPDTPKGPAEADAISAREARLKELFRRMFRDDCGTQ